MSGAAATTQTQKANKRRFGRKSPKKTSAASALAKNKLRGPGQKIVDWRASSNERWSVTAAKVQEKMAHWGASMKLGLYTATHPVHPIRREAAKQAMVNKKAAATERKVQKISAAHSRAAAKRARAREARVASLNQAVH